MPDLAELNLVIKSDQVTTANAAMNTMVDTAKRLEVQVNVTAQAFGNANTAANNQTNTVSKLSSGYGDLFRQVIQLAGGLGLITSAYQAFEAAAQQQKVQLAFTTLTGSVVAAQNAVNDLRNLSDNSSFSFGGLAEAEKQLLALGYAADQVPATLKKITDAASALGGGDDSLERIVTSLVRIQEQGTVSARTLQQLELIGIPANKIFTDALAPDNYVRALQLVEKGAVSAAQANQILLDGLAKYGAGGTEKSLNTLGGAFDQLKNNIVDVLKQGALDLDKAFNITGLLQEASRGLQLLGQVISVLTGVETGGKKASAAAEQLARWLVVIGGSLAAASIVQGFVEAAAAIKAAGGAAAALNLVLEANPFGLLALAVGGAAAAILYLKDVTVQFEGQTVTIGDLVVSTWNVIGETIVADTVMAAKLIKDAWQGVQDFFINSFKMIDAASSSLFDSLTSYAKLGATSVLSTLVAANPLFTSLGQQAGNSFGNGLSKAAATAVTTGFVGAGGSAIDRIISGAVQRGKDRQSSLSITDSSSATVPGLNGLNNGTSLASQELEKINTELDRQVELLQQNNVQARIGAEVAKDSEVVQKAITAYQFQSLGPQQAAIAAARAQFDALEQIRQKLTTINYEKSLNELSQMTDQLKTQALLVGSDQLTQQKVGALQKVGDSLGISTTDLISLTNGANDTATAIANISTQAGLSTKQVANLATQLKTYMTGLDQLDQKKQLQDLSKAIGDDFGKPLDEIIDKTTTLKKAFKDLFDSILQTLQKQLITQPFTNLISGLTNSTLGAVPGFSGALGAVSNSQSTGNVLGNAILGGLGNVAKGFGSLLGLDGGASADVSSDTVVPAANIVPDTAVLPSSVTPDLSIGDAAVFAALGKVFDRGVVQQFATGGVVTRPTMFPMATGMGMMGEAGPEAIVPLHRGTDGRLGIRQAGGGSSDAITNHNYNVTMNVSTPDVNSFRAGSQSVTRRIQDQLKRSNNG